MFIILDTLVGKLTAHRGASEKKDSAQEAPNSVAAKTREISLILSGGRVQLSNQYENNNLLLDGTNLVDSSIFCREKEQGRYQEEQENPQGLKGSLPTDAWTCRSDTRKAGRSQCA
jgi:hypothetical protein